MRIKATANSKTVRNTKIISSIDSVNGQIDNRANILPQIGELIGGQL